MNPVKFSFPDWAALTPKCAAGELPRLLEAAEAKVTAQLDHPGIIPIYGLSSDDENGIHLAMKLVNGKTLRDYLRNITLTTAFAESIPSTKI